jgi:hypothetical protein
MPHHEHIVKSYDSELERLYGEITRMGEIAVAQLDAAIDALVRPRLQGAPARVGNDIAIDELEQEVSPGRAAPAGAAPADGARLREVYGALRISADIERIGDYAKNVAKALDRAQRGGDRPAANALPELAKTANALVRDAMVAFRTATRRWRWRCAAATSSWTSCTPACSASCSPTWSRTRAPSPAARTCCSSARTSSASATTPPTSPSTACFLATGELAGP